MCTDRQKAIHRWAQKGTSERGKKAHMVGKKRITISFGNKNNFLELP